MSLTPKRGPMGPTLQNELRAQAPGAPSGSRAGGELTGQHVQGGRVWLARRMPAGGPWPGPTTPSQRWGLRSHPAHTEMHDSQVFCDFCGFYLLSGSFCAASAQKSVGTGPPTHCPWFQTLPCDRQPRAGPENTASFRSAQTGRSTNKASPATPPTEQGWRLVPPGAATCGGSPCFPEAALSSRKRPLRHPPSAGSLSIHRQIPGCCGCRQRPPTSHVFLLLPRDCF